MQTFLGICEDLRLGQTSLNRQRLLASLPALLGDTVFFLICGYDFVYHPNDRKFEGIGELFVRPYGPHNINLGKKCVDRFFDMQSSPSFSASVEGTAWLGKPGMRVNFNPAQMRQAGGVRVGGAGNYNLQTKALDMLLTDDKDGLDRQQMITGGRGDEHADNKFTWPRLQRVCLAPHVVPSELSEATLAQMRDNVLPYWGGDTINLGL